MAREMQYKIGALFTPSEALYTVGKGLATTVVSIHEDRIRGISGWVDAYRVNFKDGAHTIVPAWMVMCYKEDRPPPQTGDKK